jgi:hypothetical protein
VGRQIRLNIAQFLIFDAYGARILRRMVYKAIKFSKILP